MSRTHDKGQERRMERERARAVRFLRAGPAQMKTSTRQQRVLLETTDRGTISVPAETIEALRLEGLVIAGKDGHLLLSEVGVAHARRAESRTEPFRAQHWRLDHTTVDVGGKRQAVAKNLGESPLGHLARHKTRSGAPFLSQAEFDAGERLRADYTRGQLMPRLSANWVATVAAGRRGAGRAGVAELTDAALAARQRVDRALAAVGPELAGVLVDVCCFLKGLEQVETERGWPVRSAKVVLKTALGALSRHYQPGASRSPDSPPSVLHWGAEGYRPTLSQA
ncbi:DUF6456 domain-containing protein [Nitratireductor sp. ZSWI3]|uniref:DUF6456 domain-containing protein n=1 Tax=Nitratireductor sp. ZSWI3 TaxID=2966359 RepID=UPI00214FEBCA|nr:DUF6456 domain-containing protein [Nitratireductor sp. ZSWI3]MCR4265330.1 DUF6456 domain-containing protein [Nitratireductor sp. ZSWI3]